MFSRKDFTIYKNDRAIATAASKQDAIEFLYTLKSLGDENAYTRRTRGVAITERDAAIAKTDHLKSERDSAIRGRHSAIKERDAARDQAQYLRTERDGFRDQLDAAREECEKLRARVAELEERLSIPLDDVPLYRSNANILWLPAPGDKVHYMVGGKVENRIVEDVRIQFEGNNWLNLSKGYPTAAAALRAEGSRLLAQAEEMEKNDASN